MRDNEEGIEVNKHEQKEEDSFPDSEYQLYLQSSQNSSYNGKEFPCNNRHSCCLYFFAIIDVLQETAYIRLLPSGDLADIIIAVLVAASLAAFSICFLNVGKVKEYAQ